LKGEESSEESAPTARSDGREVARNSVGEATHGGMILYLTMQGTGGRGKSLDSARIQTVQLTSRRLLPGCK
jgi:hypothetical protein